MHNSLNNNSLNISQSDNIQCPKCYESSSLENSIKDKINLVANFLLYDEADIRVYNDVYYNPQEEIIKQLDILFGIRIVYI